MTSLLEEVFSQNKTLIEVLDESGVTNIDRINERTTQLESDSVQQKSQLDSLGRTLDTYQKSNEAQLASLNTRINSNSARIGLLEEQTSEMAAKIATISSQITDLVSTVEQIKKSINEFDELDAKISVLANRLDTDSYLYERDNILVIPTDITAVLILRTTIQYRSDDLNPPHVNFGKSYFVSPPIFYNSVEYDKITFVMTGRLTGGYVTNRPLVITGYQTVILSSDSTRRTVPAIVLKI